MSFTNVEAPATIEPQGIYLPSPDKTRSTDTPTNVKDRTIPLVNIPSAPNSQHVSVLEPSGRQSIERDITEVDRLETIWNPYKNRYRVLAACITLLGNGMNDAATGTLIQSFERHYSINYGTLSIIFLCNAAGFLASAFVASTLTKSLGRAKTLMIAETLLVVGYIIVVVTPPFAAVCVAFFILGAGMSLILAIGQVYCANLANNTVITGLYQGAYGIGGIIAPLIATSIVSRGYLWSRFYLILLGLAVFNFFFASWAFWKYETKSDPILPRQVNEPRATMSQRTNWGSIKALLTHRTTILGALFIFAYQGAEVAISGWVISFLIQFRNGDPAKVGYVTSGFWAGIALSRFTLSFLAHRIGERRSVYAAMAAAAAFEFIIWFVYSIPGDSVAVAFSGLVLGVVSPAAIHIFQRLIPNEMHIASLSLIGSIGTSGGAIAPFMVGIIAQKVETYVLHPICIGLFVFMALSWWALPETESKSE
ncbi:putative MFS efflux transporter [Mollisia scopiformis]|uniref:Putative MFS efflux transporter n=1 Tax=Mollisia scopiformis TaxID=149040 RepID=A0A194XPD7_MOLSC|nr:putative MFS efflux transporter [Mollisia scopiformis]KUJ22115.1 putative MFS efflux transporter [Mollisia scopiformis]